jgi:hypothetical protein
MCLLEALQRNRQTNGDVELNTLFATTDVDLAAYLYTRAYPVVRTAVIGESVVFAFPSEAALSAEAFYQGAAVSAKNVLHAARELDYLKRKGMNENHYA